MCIIKSIAIHNYYVNLNVTLFEGGENVISRNLERARAERCRCLVCLVIWCRFAQPN